MAEKLVSAQELADALGMSKQGLHKAEREGRVEGPKYILGKYKGWTNEQLERIRRVYHGK